MGMSVRNDVDPWSCEAFKGACSVDSARDRRKRRGDKVDKSLKDLKSEVLKLQSEIFTLKSGRRDDQLRIVTMVVVTVALLQVPFSFLATKMRRMRSRRPRGEPSATSPSARSEPVLKQRRARAAHPSDAATRDHTWAEAAHHFPHLPNNSNHTHNNPSSSHGSPPQQPLAAENSELRRRLGARKKSSNSSSGGDQDKDLEHEIQAARDAASEKFAMVLLQQQRETSAMRRAEMEALAAENEEYRQRLANQKGRDRKALEKHYEDARQAAAQRIVAEKMEAEAMLCAENRVLRQRLQMQKGRDQKALTSQIEEHRRHLVLQTASVKEEAEKALSERNQAFYSKLGEARGKDEKALNQRMEAARQAAAARVAAEKAATQALLEAENKLYRQRLTLMQKGLDKKTLEYEMDLLQQKGMEEINLRKAELESLATRPMTAVNVASPTRNQAVESNGHGRKDQTPSKGKTNGQAVSHASDSSPGDCPVKSSPRGRSIWGMLAR